MKPTSRQIAAVHFCEEWLHISFKDRQQVSVFLVNIWMMQRISMRK